MMGGGGEWPLRKKLKMKIKGKIRNNEKRGKLHKNVEQGLKNASFVGFKLQKLSKCTIYIPVYTVCPRRIYFI